MDVPAGRCRCRAGSTRSSTGGDGCDSGGGV